MEKDHDIVQSSPSSLLSVEYEIKPPKLTPRIARVQKHFGIGFDSGTRRVVTNLPTDCLLSDRCEGTLVYLYGDSGCGKSSVLRQIKELFDAKGFEDDKLPDKALIDTFDDYGQATYLLSLTGLAEAYLFLRKPSELSDGQRYRYRLAHLIDAGYKSIIMDEFCANLDRTTAKAISYNLRKVADRFGINFYVATTHTDIKEDLQADASIHLDGRGGFEIEERGEKKDCSLMEDITFRRGRLKDWGHFKYWHYKEGAEAFVTDVFIAEYKGEKIAYCSYGMPAIQCGHRNKIFGPETYQRDLKRLNKEVRNLKRVVVAPQFRGIGLAVTFIKWTTTQMPYLFLETVDAMATVSKFNQKAGFKMIGKTDGARRKALIAGKKNKGKFYGGAVTENSGAIYETWYYLKDNRKNYEALKETETHKTKMTVVRYKRVEEEGAEKDD
jgi:ABC-type ATPase with predicted acetyltransferase domain